LPSRCLRPKESFPEHTAASRQSLVFPNVPAMQQPEAYIGGADKLFDASGKLINDGTRKFLQNFIEAFANWVEIHAKS
jgi:chromate reductase, NAD(P)H dehydrogenase (quinone)